jgi:hypothetical protein
LATALDACRPDLHGGLLLALCCKLLLQASLVNARSVCDKTRIVPRRKQQGEGKLQPKYLRHQSLAPLAETRNSL